MRDLKRLLFATCLTLPLAASPAAAVCTFYVRSGFVPVDGVADGRSPARAFATITAGVAAITNPGDVVCVGPGLYIEGDLGPTFAGGATVSGFPVEIRGDASGASTGDPPGPVRIEPPTGLPPELTPRTAFRLLGRRDVIIEGFTIRRFADAGIQVRSAVVGGANSGEITIRHNHVSECRTGIDVSGEDTMIIEHNTVVANTSSGISVQSCEIADPFGTCRGLPSGRVVPVVSNNRIGGNGAHGLFLRGSEHAVVQNNVIYANAFTGMTLRGSPDALLVNNLVYRNGDEGIAIGSGFVAPEDQGAAADMIAAPNAIVLNNTVYENGEWGIEIGNRFVPSPGAAVVNNIVWRNGGGALGIGVLNERGATQVRAPSVCGYVAGFNAMLDAYGPDTPRNAYDLRDDPLFVHPAGADGVLGGEYVEGVFVDRSGDDDFRLRQGAGEGAPSPAVDAGATEAALLGLTGSTASDGRGDSGRVDLGFHYGAVPEQMVMYTTPFMPLYVRPGGDDANEGMSPTDPFATIATAARRARAGITVIVGPGTYRECDLGPPPDSGRATFLADAAGSQTGDAPGITLIDAGRCHFDPEAGAFQPGQTGFNVARACDVVIDGFHITGAFDDGIQVLNTSDRAIVRNNVVFANAKRGINVANSDDVLIRNNLAYGNAGGIQLGSGSAPAAACADAGARRTVVEFNTAYASTFDGLLIGAGACPSTGATVRYNVVAGSGKSGLEVGSDATRAANLVGYQSRYNLVGDRYGAGVPRGPGDLLLNLAIEPLYVAPTGITLQGDWRADTAFRLVQRAAGDGQQSRAVDFSDELAEDVDMAGRSTRRDGWGDEALVDLGYHYPMTGAARRVCDCNDDGAVGINEIILAVNIALGQAALTACPPASADGEAVDIADLIRAVNAALGS